MGEAKRRRNARENAAIERGMEAMHKEGQGVWELEVYDFRTALAATLAADTVRTQQAQQIAQAVRQYAQKLAAIPAGSAESLLCLTCDHGFTCASPPPAALVILKAAVATNRTLMTNLLCAPCSAHPDVQQRMMATYRQSLPDLREIVIGAPGTA